METNYNNGRLIFLRVRVIGIYHDFQQSFGNIVTTILFREERKDIYNKRTNDTPGLV
jgi:hypothetical protein